jgi:large subunit ribosomal protein L17
VIRKRETTAKLFDELADRFRERPGGYTRVLKTRRRTGDAAQLSIVELVEAMETVAPAPRKKAGKKKASKKKAAAKAEPDAKASKKKSAKKKTAKKKKAAAKASD